jgi:hypothetical protein
VHATGFSGMAHTVDRGNLTLTARVRAPTSCPKFDTGINDFGFDENPSNMYFEYLEKFTMQYKHIDNLSVLMKSRLLGTPEDASIWGLDAVYVENDLLEIGIVRYVSSHLPLVVVVVDEL